MLWLPRGWCDSAWLGQPHSVVLEHVHLDDALLRPSRNHNSMSGSGLWLQTDYLIALHTVHHTTH